MIAALATICLGGGFPDAPSPEEMRRGAAVFAEGRGLDRVLLEDRKAIGWWFDGRTKRDVEECVRLSPALLARWLGYLEAKEKWYPGETQKRWRRLQLALSGKLMFVVKLVSFPRYDLLQAEFVGRGDAREVDEVQFLLTRGPALTNKSGRGAAGRYEPTSAGRLPLWPIRLARLRSRDRSDIDTYKWFFDVPFAEELRPRFEARGVGQGYSLGPNHGAWYLLERPRPEGFDAWESYEVRIFSPGKERVAPYASS